MEDAFRPGQWGDPLATRGPTLGGGLRFAAIVAAHAVVLWGGIELAARPEVRAAVDNIMVRLVEPPKPAEPPPKQEPPKPKRESKPLPPPPVLTAAAEAPAVSSFVVPVQPPAPPVPPPPSAPIAAAPVAAPPAIVAARFDADYLSNPKPVYPSASRRLGEEGKVVLRVHVSVHGNAHAVEIRHSSGFARLDEAARAAVEQWRFVPAKRGEEPVASWVLVPIVFSLQA
jgi:protein TonB